MKKIRSAYIIVSVLLCSLIMNYVDAFIQPPYFQKSLIKIILFLVVPLIYFFLNKEVRMVQSLFLPKKKILFQSLALGAAVYGIILAAYFIIRNWFDFSAIADKLISTAGVNADNFVYIALYISFVNSMLEEFFFRGFAFIALKKHSSKKFAYIFSSFMFSLYHTGMTAGWFHPLLFILMMIGLFVGGCIFNYLNEKCENIYPSWLVHMCANFAINTVGFILFGII